MKSAALSLLIVCGTMLAARGTRCARPRRSVTEDVPVAGASPRSPTPAEARPVPDRARFVAELARVIYSQPSTGPYSNEPIRRRIAAFFADAGQPDRRDGVPEDDGAGAAVRGALEPGRLPSAGRSPRSGRRDPDRSIRGAALLRPVGNGRRDAAVFRRTSIPRSAGSPSARRPSWRRSGRACTSSGNRVVAPGGDAAAPLWEGVVGEKLNRGRSGSCRSCSRATADVLAYLYDVLSHLDAADARVRARIVDPRTRGAR